MLTAALQAIGLRDDAAVRDWPAWAREQVQVHPPDEAWQRRGEQERQLLDATLAAWLVAAVEHVGSTAVPGLPTKPILDLQAVVADLESAPDIAAALAPDTWHYVPPELDGRPWRRLFVKVVDGRRAGNLHVMARGSARWGEQLAFRDALRADPALAQRYATLKQSLAVRHADDREAYTLAACGSVAWCRAERRPAEAAPTTLTPRRPATRPAGEQGCSAPCRPPRSGG